MLNSGNSETATVVEVVKTCASVRGVYYSSLTSDNTLNQAHVCLMVKCLIKL